MRDPLVFDSYPIISFLRKEANYQAVKEILEEAFASRTRLVISSINQGEVYYIIFRSLGEDRAEQVLTWMSAMRFHLHPSTPERVLAAARIKARFPVSYADAFAIAAARELDCPVITGDPEFRQVEQAGMVKVTWV